MAISFLLSNMKNIINNRKIDELLLESNQMFIKIDFGHHNLHNDPDQNNKNMFLHNLTTFGNLICSFKEIVIFPFFF